MSYNNDDPYFAEKDGVYSENLNTAMLLSGMFEMVGQVNVPTNFRDKSFSMNESPQRVRFISMILENNSTTNNGNNLVANSNQSFVLNTRVVLGLFKSWKSISIEGSNVNVQIAIKKTNGTLIKNITNNEDLTNYNISEKHIKIEIKANNSCVINNICLEVNTNKFDNDSGVKISQEQIIGLDEWKNNIQVETTNIKDNAVTNDKIEDNAGIPLSKLSGITTVAIGAMPTSHLANNLKYQVRTTTLKAANTAIGSNFNMTLSNVAVNSTTGVASGGSCDLDLWFYAYCYGNLNPNPVPKQVVPAGAAGHVIGTIPGSITVSHYSSKNTANWWRQISPYSNTFLYEVRIGWRGLTGAELTALAGGSTTNFGTKSTPFSITMGAGVYYF